MDWTSIYDENGEEEFHFDRRSNMAPRISRLINVIHKYGHLFSGEDDEDSFENHRLCQLGRSRSNLSLNSSTSEIDNSYSSFTGSTLYFLTINYILGVGCLGIPYAFSRAGFLLCGAVIVIISVVSYETVLWVAEAGARYESFGLLQREKMGKCKEDHNIDEHSPTIDEQTRLVKIKTCHDKHDKHENFDTCNTNDQYEVIDLVSFYLGPFHKVFYQYSLMALMSIGLLAFSQVFSETLLTFIIPDDRKGNSNGDVNEFLAVALFGLVVVPLSCTELDDQIFLQALMALFRFVAILIMIIGACTSLFFGSHLNNGEESSITGIDGTTLDEQDGPPYFAQDETKMDKINYTYCFSGFGVAFSTALFSQLFQHSVPGLIRPLRHRESEERKVPFIFMAVLTTTCLFYLLLGTTTASYFGTETNPSVNLNFKNFAFGLDLDNEPLYVKLICRLASNIVVLFPALDTLSVFPLIAITLGNNLLAASGEPFLKWIANDFLPKWIRLKIYVLGYTDSSEVLSSPDGKKKLMCQASRVGTMFWRLVASLPPLLASIWARDLSFSFQLAGVAGLYVAFVVPCLLQLKSSSHGEYHFKNNGSNHTRYSGWYSKSYLTYPVLLFAAFALGVVLIQIEHSITLIY